MGQAHCEKGVLRLGRSKVSRVFRGRASPQRAGCFLRSFDVVFHMFKCINKTFHQKKKNVAGKKLEKV